MNVSPLGGDAESRTPAADGHDAWIEAVRAGAMRIQARPDITTTDVDDELILYDPADGSTHALNLTAALIWELCDGTYTLDGIAQEVAAAFNLARDRARADAEGLLAQFYGLGLLQSGPEASV